MFYIDDLLFETNIAKEEFNGIGAKIERRKLYDDIRLWKANQDGQNSSNESDLGRKYMTLIGGEVAAVQTAVDAAVETINFGVIDHFVIPNVHPDIFPAIAGHTGIQLLESLGIIESFSVASLIEAADAAVKAASVKLIEVRLAMALGGKAFVTMTGEVAAVTAAVEAGAALVSEKGLLVNKVIIAQPRQELLNEMI